MMEPIDERTLNPCPLCGHEVKVWAKGLDEDMEYIIECDNDYCGLTYGMSYGYDYEGIRKMWNSATAEPKIYGNEHNCIMTIFGECSYSETGCGSCEVVSKVNEALRAERPKGEWLDMSNGGRIKYIWYEKYMCNKCGERGTSAWSFCPNCGVDMRGEKE